MYLDCLIVCCVVVGQDAHDGEAFPHGCRQGVLLKGPSGTLVGQDMFGNKYFENNLLAYGE